MWLIAVAVAAAAGHAGVAVSRPVAAVAGEYQDSGAADPLFVRRVACRRGALPGRGRRGEAIRERDWQFARGARRERTSRECVLVSKGSASRHR